MERGGVEEDGKGQAGTERVRERGAGRRERKKRVMQKGEGRRE